MSADPVNSSDRDRERVNEMLREVYTESGIENWWKARNRDLGHRSAEELWATDQQRVIRYAERITGGSW